MTHHRSNKQRNNVTFRGKLSLCAKFNVAIYRTVVLLSTFVVATGTFLFSDPSLCTSSLLRSGFNIFDFDGYSKWFNDASVMELAQAGQYKGPFAIEEYVRFIVLTSPYMEKFVNFDTMIIDINYDHKTGKCVMLGTAASVYKTDDANSEPLVSGMSTLMKLYYTVP